MYLFMNYCDLINTVCPVNCLIYTVQSPARSYPFFFFFGYINLDYTPQTIQCVQCTSINASYALHSQGFICCILPGLLRGVLSFQAEGERKHPDEGSTLTADSRVTRGSLPFPWHWLPQSRSQALLGTPISSITGKYESQRHPRQKPQKTLLTISFHPEDHGHQQVRLMSQAEGEAQASWKSLY